MARSPVLVEQYGRTRHSYLKPQSTKVTLLIGQTTFLPEMSAEGDILRAMSDSNPQRPSSHKETQAHRHWLAAPTREIFKWFSILVAEVFVGVKLPTYFPYALLVVSAYLTWELLNIRVVRTQIFRAYSRYGAKHRMATYSIIFILGGGLLCFYWWSISRVFQDEVSDAKSTPSLTRTNGEGNGVENPKGNACQLKIDAQVVGRLYGDIIKAPLPGSEIDADLKFQELFYQWTTTITSEQNISEVSITVDHLASEDRLSVTPDDALISELKPKWVSGYEEPSRKPDYYARTFRFTNLSKDRPASIGVRRPINDLAINNQIMGEPNIIRVSDAVTTSCHVDIPHYDAAKEIQRLSRQMKVLASWQYGGLSKPPLPIKPASRKMPASGEAQVAVDAWCENETCERVIVGRMQVNWGGPKTPPSEKPKKIEATPTAPSTPQASLVPAERVVVDVTPEYLVGFFNSYTAIQANKLAEAYIGKWMKTSGIVQDVTSNPDSILVLFRPPQQGPLVYAHFREQRWTDRLITLKLGDHLVVFGQIRNADRLTLFMDKCEIVD